MENANNNTAAYVTPQSVIPRKRAAPDMPLRQYEEVFGSDTEDDEIKVVPETTSSTASLLGRFVGLIGEADQGRNWVFTINNPTLIDRSDVERIECKYLVVGEEFGETNGVPHLQGYVMFNSNKRRAAVSKMMPRAWIAVAKGTPEQCFNYCTKDDCWKERGTRPVFVKNAGEREKRRWDQIKASAIAGKLNEVPDDVFVQNYCSLSRIAKDHMRNAQDNDSVCGVWISGPAGVGKSRMARAEYGANPDEVYFKMCNKWWDGYQNQPNVIIDDFDISHGVLGHHLKIWADRYSFVAENKGGAFNIRPKKIVVTSQYTIEEIWTDPETRQALNRRFAKVTLGQKENYPIFNPPSPPIILVRQTAASNDANTQSSAGNSYPDKEEEIVEVLESPIGDENFPPNQLGLEECE